jgi:hypothetical protein
MSNLLIISKNTETRYLVKISKSFREKILRSIFKLLIGTIPDPGLSKAELVTEISSVCKFVDLRFFSHLGDFVLLPVYACNEIVKSNTRVILCVCVCVCFFGKFRHECHRMYNWRSTLRDQGERTSQVKTLIKLKWKYKTYIQGSTATLAVD